MNKASSTEVTLPEPRSTRSNTYRSARLHRIVIATAIAFPVAYALLINADSLNNPPAWDSSTTVSPAALTIVDYDFNVWEVAQLPSSLEGGPSIHSTSVYTIALAVLIWFVGPATAFYIAHVGSIALVGALSAATYLLARERTSVYVSAFAAATVSIVPLVVQQAADVYLDLPLAVIISLACWAASRRLSWATTALVFLGIAIKTAGVFLIPLILLARPVIKPLNRHLTHSAVAMLVALVPFLLAFATTDRFEAGREPWSLTLITSSASMLFLTADVFILLAVYLLVVYGRARSADLDRVTAAGAVAVAGFLAAYGGTMLLTGTVAILPRYYVAILPVMLVTLLPGRDSMNRRTLTRVASLGFVAVLALFSLLNVRGDLYYLPDHPFYVVAERSTRAQDLLELQVLGTERLVATGLPLVVDNLVYFRLAYPDMGYVDATPANVVTTLQPPEVLPDHFAMLIERRFARHPLIGVEERALEEGYTLAYENLTYRGFQSELIIASR